jgi:hypothetical protein
MDEEMIKMEQTIRKTIVKTAQGYYEVARGLNTDGEVYSQAERLYCMGEALNHTESALHKACCLLEEFLAWEYEDDNYELDPVLKKESKEFLENMRYKQE